jgi:hypothetical protein
MRAGHLRRGPGFVDEDEVQGIKVELALEPVFPPLPDVGPILLTRVCGPLFASACGGRGSAKARRRSPARRTAPIAPSASAGDVRRLDKKGPDEIAMLFGAPQQPIAA